MKNLKSLFNFSLPLIACVLTFCTSKDDHRTNPKKYHDDTELMLNISSKFLFEPDANKLHQAAVATEQSRVIGCADYNGECTFYGKFIAKCIEISADGTITSEERKELEILQAQLKGSIKEGRKKLKD